MSKHGKKYEKAQQSVPAHEQIPLRDALQQLKQVAYAKFDETVDVDVNLGIDAAKGDQAVRGSVVMPHGRGKTIRVIVFAKGEHAEQAEKAGADVIGSDDLVQKILDGWMEFEYAVATPDLMGIVGKLAKQLGPRGLLPNKKLGTVTFDVGAIVRELKMGRSFFKNDKSGLVHFSVGKVSFDVNQLVENMSAFLKALVSAKPSASKGKFIKKISVSSTMGPGFTVAPEDVL